MLRYLKNLKHKAPQLFKDKTEVAIFLTVFLVEIAFGLYLVYRWGATFISGDAVSHLYIPKTVINNGEQSNFANLGTSWLPMFHILVMPLVWIKPLYSTGFAGTIVNGLATGGICVIVYRLIGDKKLGILASILFLANAYTLVYGATPMMDQTAIFFTVLAVYYFKRYWEKDDLVAFMKCSLVLFFGTLTRYEVWLVALLIASFFLVKELKGRHFHRLAYIHFPFWGVFAWLFWNLAIFRDPLFFLPQKSYPWPSLYVTTFAEQAIPGLLLTSGMLFLATAVSIILLLARRKKLQILEATLLTSPILFHLFMSVVQVGQFYPRYFFLGFLGLLVTPILLLKDYKKSSGKLMIGASLVLISLLAIAYPQQAEFMISGTTRGEYLPKNLYDKMEMRMIKEVVDDRTIIISSWALFGAQTYSVYTNTEPFSIIDDYDGELYLKAMAEPWKLCDFVAIMRFSKKTYSTLLNFNNGLNLINDHYGGTFYVYRYYNDDAWRSLFLSKYELILETENFLVYQIEGALET